jgi:coproporphyrinogen III oxidase
LRFIIKTVDKKDVESYFKTLQDTVCSGLEKADGKAKFKEDLWERPEGGGGRTRVIKEGNVIEKGGVNFSSVFGNCPDFLKKEMGIPASEQVQFFASGVSIVIHPVNPFVPIIHMNVRYFEAGKHSWFGGGIDLTPHYVDKEDAKAFHATLKKACDKHNAHYYPEFKKWADEYFYIPHRNETRGIGGIFFDKLGGTDGISIEQRFEFVKEVGNTFLEAYVPLIEKNRDKKYTENNRQWQLLRRGRYVEFNLVYDRGTKFGLLTNGRAESILMSLPPFARWEYSFSPNNESPENQTLTLLKREISWIA